jgi:hypothetical protein
MADRRTLTSANSIITLAIAGLYDAPRQLQGFSADAVFDTDQVTSAETMMGVDGKLSAGWVPAVVVTNITLQADSASNDLFDRWYQAQQTIRELYVASGAIVLPSLGKKLAYTRGFLTSFPPTPSMARVAQPRRYTITWESVSIAPI